MTFPAFDSAEAWLTYRGHWGQHEPGVSNGPTGPNTKRQWLEPFRWMGGLRTSTPTVPRSGTLGDPVAGVFCGTVSSMSGLLNDTSSSPTCAPRVRHARRRLRESGRPHALAAGRRDAFARAPRRGPDRRLLGPHLLGAPAGAAPIGLVAVPLGALAVGGQALLFHSTGLRRAFDALEDDKAEGFVALLVGGIAHGVAPILVGASAALVFRESTEAAVLLRAACAGSYGASSGSGSRPSRGLMLVRQ